MAALSISMPRTLMLNTKAMLRTPVPWACTRRMATRSRAAAGRPAVPVPEVYSETSDPEILAFQQHQQTAARPSAAEAAKTMMAAAKFGLLATVSVREQTQGLPQGSVVEFALDEAGKPVFATSTMSAHCTDLEKDGRASLTVMSPGFKGLSDGRFTLQGRTRRVTDDERAALRDAYLKKYPEAFYVDFGDFQWFIMDEVVAGQYNGGFAMAKKLSGEEYLAARPDPVAQFSPPVCSHMNKDHGDDMRGMIKHYVGMQVEDARMLDLDRLGMNFEVKHKGQSFKLRLPFVAPAEDRKGIKEAIVAMTRAAAGAPA